MTGAGRVDTPPRMARAAWAWEGLRRNADYRMAFRARPRAGVSVVDLATGATLMRARRRYADAENFGLLTFADPDRTGSEVPVFWHPDRLKGTLEVRLSPLTRSERSGECDHELIDLSRLAIPRHVFDAADGSRTILLGGCRIWLQLHCPRPMVCGERGHLGIRLNTPVAMGRSLDTAQQLLSLYRAQRGKPTLIGRAPRTKRIHDGLVAHDVWTGFERPRGGLRDIATALVGEGRVRADWTSGSRYLKDAARRARDRGFRFVGGEYARLLTQKAI